MIELNRLCIVFGTQCNIHCSYCYRDTHIIPVPNHTTEKFEEYLKNLTQKTEVICASGGEPLIYLDEIKHVFSLIPEHIHKKIMTNGLLLNDSTLDYINNNNIEIHLSYDGPMSNITRGVNVLDNPYIASLVRKIKNLYVVATITNLNSDVMEIYQDIRKRIGHDFYFNPNPIFENGHNQYLIKDFDYDTFTRSYSEYVDTYSKSMPPQWYSRTKSLRKQGLNVLLDGTVVGINTMNIYGTVWDSNDQIDDTFHKIEKNTYCWNHPECEIQDTCRTCPTSSGEHICRIRRVQHACNAITY